MLTMSIIASSAVSAYRVTYQSGYYVTCYNGNCASNGWSPSFTNQNHLRGYQAYCMEIRASTSEMLTVRGSAFP